MAKINQFFLTSLLFASSLIAADFNADVVSVDAPHEHQQAIPDQQQVSVPVLPQVPTQAPAQQIPNLTNNPFLAAPNNPPSDETVIDMGQILTPAQIRADLNERWWYERWAYHYLNCTACMCVQFGGLIETLSIVCTFLGIISTGVLGISTLEQSIRSPLIVISTTLTAFCVVAPRLATAFFKISTQRENLADDYAQYGRADPRHLQPITMSPSTVIAPPAQSTALSTDSSANPAS